MRTELFDYYLPQELIAQEPLPRGDSRLLVIHRNDQSIEHRHFSDLPEYIVAGDTLVLNDTRVTARRLHGLRENGLPAEVFLLNPIGEKSWEALVRPGKSLRPGKIIGLHNREGINLTAKIVGVTEAGGRIIELPDAQSRDLLAGWGETPLPPYIHSPLPHDQEERYQTVYANQGGSAAAPTAGLHFTPAMLAALQENQVALAKLTLEVGIGTFRPVRVDEVEKHEMHFERFSLSHECANIVNDTAGRIVAVGTTVVRTLESSAIDVSIKGGDRVAARFGDTRLFITPGYQFKAVDAMITNFHLPRSTLLMLVASYAGYDLMMQAYREAVEYRYRFFSFGDAMLIL